MNVAQTIELMKRAGWTAQQFMDSLNSSARAAAHNTYLRTKRMPDVVPQIDLATAELFLASGKGVSGPAYDVLEQWSERRTSYSNIAGPVFQSPTEKRVLPTATPLLVLPDETSLEKPIVFRDVTNERARQKALGRG